MALFLLWDSLPAAQAWMLRMIRLTLSGADFAPDVVLSATVFRMTGGIVWSELRRGAIARYSAGSWLHQRRPYARLTFDGPCRFAFGLIREPPAVSQPINSLVISGTTLRVNGVPIAEYVEASETWGGLIRQSWWMSLQIVAADQYPNAEQHPAVRILNPWDPVQPAPSA
jgi:hypothetical protein